MNRQRIKRMRVGAVLGGIGSLAVAAWAGLSLAVRFPDIVVENIQPGTVVNLRQMKGVPYVVINQADIALDIQVDPEIPFAGPAQAKEGYEPVPQADWLRIVPNRFKLNPGEIGTAEVILSVPADPGLVGKHFQANIRAKTENTGQLALAVAHYVRFSVGTAGPAALAKEKNRKALGNLDLDLTPPNIRWEGVPLGKPLSLKSTKGTSLKVTNRGNDAVQIKLVSVKVDNNLREPGWVETPHPEWLSVKPEVIKVKPNQIKDVQLFVNIPDAPENKGKKFLFLVKAELADLGIPLQFYTRVYVQTE